MPYMPAYTCYVEYNTALCTARKTRRMAYIRTREREHEWRIFNVEAILSDACARRLRRIENTIYFVYAFIFNANSDAT